ncbi:MAG TPA: hypothetical protein VJN71_05170 [Nitrososphaerales archaeon]|nr:hypothetical protein [Nitrososphaerales archaeon]
MSKLTIDLKSIAKKMEGDYALKAEIMTTMIKELEDFEVDESVFEEFGSLLKSVSDGLKSSSAKIEIYTEPLQSPLLVLDI